MNYRLYILTGLLFLAACGNDTPLPEGGGDAVGTPTFALATRAEGENTTYRLLAYSTAEGNNYLGDTYKTVAPTYTGTDYNYGTGTYYLPDGAASGTPLIPCSVDEDGTFQADSEADPTQAIHGSLGNVLIACISPAIKHNADGTISYDPSSGNPFLCSQAEEVTVNGYGTLSLRNPLLDRRAKIVLRIYKGAELQHDFTITDNKITVKGMGDEDRKVAFNPVTLAVTVPAGNETTGRSYPLQAEENQSEENGRTLRYSLSGECIVPAADYGVPGSTQLIANFTAVRGEDIEEEVVFSLTGSTTLTEFLPETVYTYNITLASNHYDLTVTVNNWNEVTGGSDVSNTYGTTHNLGSFTYGGAATGGWSPVDTPTEYPAI